jgi:acyl-CoA thioester hydrolase
MTAAPYERTYTVIWGDVDANRHMRNTAYAEYCTHTRFAYLTSRGVTLERLSELGVGPVVFRESTEYRRELHLDDTLLVTIRLAGAAPDGSRWQIRHELYRLEPDGTRTHAAVHALEGAWFDLRSRKLTLPPAELAAALGDLPHTEDFQAMPARRGKR